MFSKILLSIAFYSGFVAASHLQYFDGPTHNSINVHLAVNERSTLLGRVDKFGDDEALEICAKQCIQEKYFCNSFAVRKVPGLFWFCNTFEKPIIPSSDSVPATNKNDKWMSVYTLKTPRIVDFRKDFSYSPSDDKWVNDIIEGYGLQANHNLWQLFLRTCQRAIVSEQLPSNIDLPAWVQGMEAFESKRDPRYTNAIAQKVKAALRQLQNNPDSKGFADIITLTFLDVFNRNARRHISTIFDAENKYLLVSGQKFNLLIAFVNEHYVMLWDKSDSDNPQPIWYETSNTFVPSFESFEMKSIWEMFIGTMHRLGYKSSFEKPLFTIPLDHDDALISAASIIGIAATTIFDPEQLQPYPVCFSEMNTLKFLRDVTRYVLCQIYMCSTPYIKLRTSHFTDVEFM